MAELDTQNPPDTERPPEPPAAPPAAETAPPRPSFLDALMRALGPIHTCQPRSLPGRRIGDPP